MFDLWNNNVDTQRRAQFPQAFNYVHVRLQKLHTKPLLSARTGSNESWLNVLISWRPVQGRPARFWACARGCRVLEVVKRTESWSCSGQHTVTVADKPTVQPEAAGEAGRWRRSWRVSEDEMEADWDVNQPNRDVVIVSV